MGQFQDAFISYGRADSKQFAQTLNQRLIEAGYEVWFDFDDIPLGVDYQQQIDVGIERSHNFLSIISPHAVNSPYCRLEVDRAVAYNKRIIPLLHVEEISRATWQQRHPMGTEADWQAYQAAGKHASFVNMHPVISKINWVYFRDGIDDFEPAFQALLAVFERQKDYVHQHTQFLDLALTWQRQQKQARYLLIGETRQQAEAWLTTKFSPQQPPCWPTDLQAEFITESTKNANGLMTQVFLAHAEADQTSLHKILNALRREGFTVWTNTTDIQTGEDFEQAVNCGIEQADNVVYLLSPQAIASPYCQHELNYALALNKRIIPIRVCPVPTEQIPVALKTLQYIDLAESWQTTDAWLDESELLKILRQDALYFAEHKVLLTKALKWQRQQRNPSILLRGYNLRHAAAWLKVAQARPHHFPTALQVEFIQESLRQPPATALDVFISYSRADSAFARRLNDALQLQGKCTWFDQESIASGADFQQEIYRGIESADNFLFILSPRSVQSPYCADEVGYAAKLNKRLVPVLAQTLSGSDLPPALATVQWLDFSQQAQEFTDSFSQLIRVLETDRDYLRSHTQWLQRAVEWQQKERNSDLLLRGSELAIAENWLQESDRLNKQPPPSDLQKSFLQASRAAADRAAKREQHRLMVMKQQLRLIAAALAIAIGGLFANGLVGWFSFRGGQQAIRTLTAQLSQTVSHNIQQRVVTYLENAYVLPNLTRQAMAAGELLPNDLDGLGRYFWRHLSFLTGQSIYFGSQSGNFVGLQHSAGQQFEYWLQDQSQSSDRLDYRLSTTGERGELLRSTAYDSRLRPWYQIAAQTGENSWSPVYAFRRSDDELVLGVSAAVPVHDAQGQLQGVISTDLLLTQISEFLQQLDISRSGQAFIIDSQGLIVASSAANTPGFVNQGDEIERQAAIDSQDPAIRAATRHLLQKFGQFDQLTTEQNSLFQLEGDRYLTDIDQVNTQPTVDWLIVTVIPEADFMDEIRANARLSLYVGIGGLILASGLSIAVYRSRQLAKREF
ncbi:TIR domain-containing protein [Almyronema epifaneia]|uniref:TIR domain-containing protein n=1 Tax=Almyronema epifaneia S1 TaxID=2991925 RepID=A0ABW6IJW2_9CYAN